jgi:hypothetical protein
MEVLPPDPQRGYYRGSRFDWSGVVRSLKFQGHEYFGVWFPRYDPTHHDCITGPVEEFVSSDGALGFAEAAEGESFVRIGIGALRKRGAKFERFGKYEMADGGVWNVRAKKREVQFEHRLVTPVRGYAYRYEKTLRLEKGAPVLWIEHRLRNVGTRVIETECYNHNFLVMDGATSGPDLTVQFPFALRAKNPVGPPGLLTRSKIGYAEELRKGQSVYTELEGFGQSPKDYDFRVENAKTGAGVRVTGDRPLSKLVFWSIPTVLSPEPYVALQVRPGGEERWRIRYEFYMRNI